MDEDDQAWMRMLRMRRLRMTRLRMTWMRMPRVRMRVRMRAVPIGG